MREDLKFIHAEFARRLIRLRMPIIKLWGTDTINGEVVCRCRNRWFGRHCQPGKHMVSILTKSIIQSEDELVKWVEAGGNIGLSLGFTKPGAPPTPLRFIVFDDDDGTGRDWLASHGITSPWIVRGKRGVHVYCILADDVPDFYTSYDYFKPHAPKMDLKTSGLMVLPLDNGKTLEIDGQMVTVESLHLLERFSSLESLNHWLPHLDPREAFPKLRVREIEGAAIKPMNGDGAQPIPGEEKFKPAARRRNIQGVTNPILVLSTVHPDEKSHDSNYRGIPYYERRRFAKEHTKKLRPSISVKDPFSKLVKAINDCIHTYGMSDQTTWELIRDHFNPRCKHKDGRNYPWKRGDVAQVIKSAHEEGRYSTMEFMKDKGRMADAEMVIVRLRRKGQAANERRSHRRKLHRFEVAAILMETLLNLGYLQRIACDDVLEPKAMLGEGIIKFKDLYDDIAEQLTRQQVSSPSRKALGGLLVTMGLETCDGLIRGKMITR